MVFSELALRGVSFFFGPYWGDMPFTQGWGNYERYRPDFILPEYRIIIEVYGHYWHTQTGSLRRDTTRAMMYTAAGYKYYYLWESAIFAGATEALNLIPELVNPSIRTGMIFLSDRPFDPTAGLRAARRKFPKVIRLKTGPRGGAISAYKPRLRAPKRLGTGRGPGFKGLPEEKRIELGQYGQEWKAYVKGLGTYFTKYPSAQKVYKKQYRYYLRWRDFWDKWQMAMVTTPQWREYIEALGGYFGRWPAAKRMYTEEYYRWVSWRRMYYRRL